MTTATNAIRSTYGYSQDFYKYKSIAYNVTSNILLSIIQCKHQNRIKNNVGIIPKSNFKIIKLIQTKRKIQHFSDLRAHLRIYQTVGCFSSRLSLWINVRECQPTLTKVTYSRGRRTLALIIIISLFSNCNFQ
jgi:hypothetical protein